MDEKSKIEQWGYSCGSDQEAAALVWPVRFKPGVTAVLVLAGLVLRRPLLLIVVGALGVLGTLFQNFSWIDLIYNLWVRKIFPAPALGPDPSVRRWLCGMADLFVLLSGVAMAARELLWAWVLGSVVLLLAGSVVFTGVCPPALLYHLWKKRLKANQGGGIP